MIDGPDQLLEGEPMVLQAERRAVWWERHTPAGDYDNQRACSDGAVRCVAPLPHQWERLERGRRLRDRPSVGTHHYVATTGERPPADAVPHTVVVRRDDTYAGFAAELLGVPFVFAPTSTPRGHQTDLREATDCVALVIYGQRRLGRAVPYVSPWALWELLVPVDDQELARGDVLHWGWQTALVAEDTAPIGVLDGTDRILLAWKGHVEERPLAELPWFGPMRRMRWPALP